MPIPVSHTSGASKPYMAILASIGRLLELFHENDPFHRLGPVAVQVTLGEVRGTASVDEIVEQDNVPFAESPVVRRQVSDETRLAPVAPRAVAAHDH